MSRKAAVHRKTKETDVTVSISLEGGAVKAATGVGFFDHMLTALGVHSGCGLEVSVVGDLEVDAHHTVEDTGIVLGQALGQALGDKGGIRRYGHAYIPMDEALGFCALDISGRPYLVFQADFPQAQMGAYDACLTEEFFRAVSTHAGLTLHLSAPYGSNSHHITEALFKAFAHALQDAAAPGGQGVLSSKGVL